MVPSSTKLPPAAWSAEADVGAERRNPVPYRDHRDVSRADAPPQARRATPNRRRARSNQTARRLPRGFLWPRGDRGTPRYSMTSSRGAWRCKRGRGHSLAVRTKRNAGKRGAPKPCSRPLSDNRHAAAAAWVGSVRRHRALSQHLLRLRPSRASEAADRPSALSYPTPAPGPRERPRGAVDCIASPRTGGANPVVARPVTRRTRPSRSSAPGAGRTGRCAGTRPRPDRC